jgi:hypothetical protein
MDWKDFSRHCCTVMRHLMEWRDMEQALDFGAVLKWVRNSQRIIPKFSNWNTTSEDFLLALIRAADGPRYQVFVHRQLNRFKDDQEHDTLQVHSSNAKFQALREDVVMEQR